jgi:5'-nucleotidase (lipoprotein e(P4) family)
METQYRRIAAFILCVFAFSWGCASTESTTGRAVPDAGGTSRTAIPVRDTHEDLNSVLWVQTSGEFWALASTTYNNAQVLLEQAKGQKSWSAALEQNPGYENLPAAVILDLDETVLDNSPAQGQFVLDRTGYLQDAWGAWVHTVAAAALPGAQSFIADAETNGVKVFFVTNRSLSEQEDTLKNLAALGITASDDTVLCSGENGWTSDKTARRAEIAKSYRILLLVGDDMNDFVSTATLTPPQRLALAKTHANRWGKSWILLPNAMYGSWERALFPGLTKDEEILLRKRQQIKGFRPR